MQLKQMAVAAVLVLSPVPVFSQEAAVPATPQSMPGEPTDAQTNAFRRCTACHSVGEDAQHRMGPHLNGIVGAPAASAEGFNYSSALIAKRDEGLVWTPETLRPFLEDPRGYVPGTKMAFAGISDEQTITDIIGYLVAFSPEYRVAGEEELPPADERPNAESAPPAEGGGS